jgi:hypothetical protein
MNLQPTLRRPLVTAVALAAALLAGCGGGDDTESLSTSVAQGYAADGTTMSVSATSSLDAAASALEDGLANPDVARTTGMQVQGVALPGGSATCAGGGSVTWGISGNTANTGNGQFDTGEIYHVTYDGCTDDAGFALDGDLTLTVNARTTGTSDLTLAASNLIGTAPNGSFTLNGSSRRERSLVAITGGTRATARFTSTGITLATVIGPRQASYQLKSLDWTIVRDFSTGGLLVARSHQGSLDLVASTPRRPNATLQIDTIGALTIGSDGLAASGRFTVATGRNTIDCTYGAGTITLKLDIGSNGTVDATWTLTRTVYNGEAG